MREREAGCGVAGADCSSAVCGVAGTGAGFVTVVTAGAGGTALAAAAAAVVEGTAAEVVCTCCGTPWSRYSTSAMPRGPHRAELKIDFKFPIQ